MKDLKQFIIERSDDPRDISNRPWREAVNRSRKTPFTKTLEEVIADSFEGNKRVYGYDRWLELLGSQRIKDSMMESIHPEDGLKIANRKKNDVIVWVFGTQAIAITIGNEIICAGYDTISSPGRPLKTLSRVSQSATHALLIKGLKLEAGYRQDPE